MVQHTFTINCDVVARNKHERKMLIDGIQNSLIGYEIPGITGRAIIKSVK